MDSLVDLKHTGLKATLPRLKILQLFRESAQRHLAAEDVYRLVLAECADIGLATVYRVLSQFEQTGLLQKSQLTPGRTVYELNDGPNRHGHLVCTQTGEVLEFFDPDIEARLKSVAAEMGFDLTHFVVNAFGVRHTPVASEG